MQGLLALPETQVMAVRGVLLIKVKTEALAEMEQGQGRLPHF